MSPYTKSSNEYHVGNFVGFFAVISSFKLIDVIKEKEGIVKGGDL